MQNLEIISYPNSYRDIELRAKCQKVDPATGVRLLHNKNSKNKKAKEKYIESLKQRTFACKIGSNFHGTAVKFSTNMEAMDNVVQFYLWGPAVKICLCSRMKPRAARAALLWALFLVVVGTAFCADGKQRATAFVVDDDSDDD